MIYIRVFLTLIQIITNYSSYKLATKLEKKGSWQKKLNTVVLLWSSVDQLCANVKIKGREEFVKKINCVSKIC